MEFDRAQPNVRDHYWWAFDRAQACNLARWNFSEHSWTRDDSRKHSRVKKVFERFLFRPKVFKTNTILTLKKTAIKDLSATTKRRKARFTTFATHLRNNQLHPNMLMIGKEASIRKLVRYPFSDIAPFSFLPVQAVLQSLFACEDSRPLFVLSLLTYVRTYCNCMCARQLVSYFAVRKQISPCKRILMFYRTTENPDLRS